MLNFIGLQTKTEMILNTGISLHFPKQLRIFSPNFTWPLNVVGPTLVCSILSPTTTKLCHIKCDHPVCVSADGGHFEHDGGRA